MKQISAEECVARILKDIEKRKTVDYADELTTEKANDIKNRAESSLFIDATKAMLDRYSEDFEIDVDYARAGFEE